jgi:succinoglycan biosynthesis protein ExoM
MSNAGALRVAICIATFRRQELLRALLDGIAQLSFHRVQAPHLHLVVVDNDEFASAREVCSASSRPWPVRYVVEPKRGITFARNRAIAEAGSVDFVAFIDDDEIPSAQWLDELLWAQAEFAADVVSGPVVPTFTPEVAGWVRRGRFFDARISATGTPRKTCASNNVLIAAEVFRRIPHFDHAFALSGAEDTDFFLRVCAAGCKIVWSQEAFVAETITSDRANVAWLLRREYQTGNGWVFCEAGVNGSLPGLAFRSAKSCGHIAIGSLTALFRLLTLDKAGVVRAAQRVSLGSGMLSALFGYRFMAYQNAGAKLTGTGSWAPKLE